MFWVQYIPVQYSKALGPKLDFFLCVCLWAHRGVVYLSICYGARIGDAEAFRVRNKTSSFLKLWNRLPSTQPPIANLSPDRSAKDMG